MVGSGFHTACISVGCSRLFLSLHSWSHENKHRLGGPFRSNTLIGNRKYPHNLHSRSASTSSIASAYQKPRVNLSSQREYKHTRPPVPDLESGGIVQMDFVSRAQGNILNASAFPHIPHPVITSKPLDIERSSLPEQDWLVPPEPNSRPRRPPRSGSSYLYERTHSHRKAESNERILPLPERAKIKLNRPLGERRGDYNVI